MEMMTHMEGPIVDSLYDMALLTWHEELKPPLPLLDKPATEHVTGLTYETQSFLDLIPDFPNALVAKAKSLNDAHKRLPAHVAGDPHYDDDIAGEMLRMQSGLTPKPDERLMNLVTEHMSKFLARDLLISRLTARRRRHQAGPQRLCP